MSAVYLCYLFLEVLVMSAALVKPSMLGLYLGLLHSNPSWGRRGREVLGFCWSASIMGRLENLSLFLSR